MSFTARWEPHPNLALLAVNAAHEEIRAALARAPSGMTARQLLSACDSAEDLQDVVKTVNALKSQGKVLPDGMRDSQVIYKLGSWPVEGNGAPKVPEVLPPVEPIKAKRSATGLREDLFEVMEMLKAKKIDVNAAKTYAALAMTILKSVEVQMDYEKLRRDGRGGELSDIPLVPAIESNA